MRVGTSVNFLNLQSQTNKTDETKNKLFEQLSAGLKVNKAADDAAGLQLANKLTSQLNGSNQAIRNASDAISFGQVADAALSGVTDASFRIEELSLQAANGSLSNSDRRAIQEEVSQLQAQIGDIYSQTQFGGQQVFGGNVDFQVGANSFQVSSISANSDSIQQLDVSTQQGAQAAISGIQEFRAKVDSERSQIGAFQNGIESNINNLTQQSISNAASRSQIIDTDYAKAVSEKTANDIQSQANTALAAQAHFSNKQALKLLI